MNNSTATDLLETKSCRYGMLSYFKSDKVIGASLREYGEWAQNEINFLLKFIEPGDIVFDIGAFIGTHTLAFAKHVGEKGCVYAIEPNPMVFNVLSLNVDQNSLTNVKLENVALSDKESVINFKEADWNLENPGGTTLVDNDGEDNQSDIPTISILAKRLDQYHVEKCRLIKIDVELMEVQVLVGAREFLRQYRPLVYVECLSVDNGAKILSIMKSEEYAGFIHVEAAYSSSNYRNNENNFFDLAREVNLIFVPFDQVSNFKKWACNFYELPAVDTLDDLVLGMLRKPQYKDEILARTNAARVYGNNFWLNELEQERINAQIADKEQTNQSLTDKLNEDAELLKTITDKENALKEQITDHEKASQALLAQLIEKEQTVKTTQEQLTTLEGQLSEKEQMRQALSNEVSQLEKLNLKYSEGTSRRDQVIHTLFSRLSKKQTELVSVENEKVRAMAQLEAVSQEASLFSSQVWEIKHSRAWSIVQLIWKLRLRILPSDSVQARMLRSVYRKVRVLKNEGIVSFLKSLKPAISSSKTQKTQSQAESLAEFQKPEPPVSFVHPNPVYISTSIEANTQDISGTTIPSKQLNDSDRLLERALSNMKYENFLVSISHDDYLTVNFGVQMVISDEQKIYDEKQISYLHLYPIDGPDYLIQHAPLSLGLNIDSAHIGQYSVDDIVDLLQKLIANDHSCVSLNLHQFKGWTRDALFSVISAVHPNHHFFYVHDYYAVCPQYTLLRNQREFCNAPPVDSHACTICMFGNKRAMHLPMVEELFTHFPFLIITPSENTKRLWIRAFPNLSNKVRVEPHLTLKESSTPLPVKRFEKIRIAYAGQGVPQKGWDTWRKLVDQFAPSSDYELFHLGSWAGKNPEYFESVRVTPENRTAMIDALKRNQIDVLFHWSILPETFSFVLYEAIVAGCFVITVKQSGNVADYVKKNKNGLVFETYSDLANYLSVPDNLRKDLVEFRKTHPYIYTLEHNTAVINLIDTPQLSGGIK